MPPQKRKTRRRYDDPGVAHSLTFSCYQQQRFLSRDRTRTWLVEAINNARTSLDFHVWAYVIMPEHCHLLVHPRRHDYSISDLLWAIKVPVARKARAYLDRTAPHRLSVMLDKQPNGPLTYRFWQRGGGYDRNLIEDEAVHRTIDYIHANPVRRGLVACPEDWRWSSA